MSGKIRFERFGYFLVLWMELGGCGGLCSRGKGLGILERSGEK